MADTLLWENIPRTCTDGRQDRYQRSSWTELQSTKSATATPSLQSLLMILQLTGSHALFLAQKSGLCDVQFKGRCQVFQCAPKICTRQERFPQRGGNEALLNAAKAKSIVDTNQEKRAWDAPNVVVDSAKSPGSRAQSGTPSIGKPALSKRVREADASNKGDEDDKDVEWIRYQNDGYIEVHPKRNIQLTDNGSNDVEDNDRLEDNFEDGTENECEGESELRERRKRKRRKRKHESKEGESESERRRRRKRKKSNKARQAARHEKKKRKQKKKRERRKRKQRRMDRYKPKHLSDAISAESSYSSASSSGSNAPGGNRLQ